MDVYEYRSYHCGAFIICQRIHQARHMARISLILCCLSLSIVLPPRQNSSGTVMLYCIMSPKEGFRHACNIDISENEKYWGRGGGGGISGGEWQGARKTR